LRRRLRDDQAKSERMSSSEAETRAIKYHKRTCHVDAATKTTKGSPEIIFCGPSNEVAVTHTAYRHIAAGIMWAVVQLE